jgi:hypothetical protein
MRAPLSASDSSPPGHGSAVDRRPLTEDSLWIEPELIRSLAGSTALGRPRPTRLPTFNLTR